MAHDTSRLESLPFELLEKPQDFRIIHEKDEKAISTDLNADQIGDLFTKLLRRNMSCFARMPQSWMLWLITKTPEQRQSFSQSHIKSINFSEDDLFCGFYRVVRRTSSKVEVRMEPPQADAAFGGMLVITLKQSDGEATLCTETLQWTNATSGVTLPLERAPYKIMHEMATLVATCDWCRTRSNVGF